MSKGFSIQVSIGASYNKSVTGAVFKYSSYRGSFGHYFLAIL
jgi:hypothetical protein